MEAFAAAEPGALHSSHECGRAFPQPREAPCKGPGLQFAQQRWSGWWPTTAPAPEEFSATHRSPEGCRPQQRTAAARRRRRRASHRPRDPAKWEVLACSRVSPAPRGSWQCRCEGQRRGYSPEGQWQAGRLHWRKGPGRRRRNRRSSARRRTPRLGQRCCEAAAAGGGGNTGGSGEAGDACAAAEAEERPAGKATQQFGSRREARGGSAWCYRCCAAALESEGRPRARWRQGDGQRRCRG